MVATRHESLHDWAVREPDRIAITDGRMSITFGELAPRIDIVAASARAALAAAPAGAFLPVLVDKSVASAVETLACLVGRVPFFPVDSNASHARRRELMRRAGDPGCFLTGASTSSADIAQRLAVSDDALAKHSVAAPPNSDDPAVVVFSSGSTGEPKGVVLSHAVMESRWRSRHQVYADLGSNLREPLVPPLDSLWGLNLLADVASGFTAYVVDVARSGPTAFLVAMAEFEASAMSLPSQFARILGHLSASSVVPLPSMRRVNIGSEGFRYEHLHRLSGILGPETTIVHNLASTEGGRELRHYFTMREAPREGPIPIGRILYPGQTRFVPAAGHPDGVTELHLSGAIASEYLSDPELTADRFYVDADGRRWWRSGDLVSQGPDGLYRHEGRLDDVVKVAGRLASPMDVTSVLMAIPGIRAAVTVPVTSDGSTRLVAHVEVEQNSDVTLGAVHDALAARLQPHAVPAAVMRHSRLPVNARGKIDRLALTRGPFEPW